MVFSVGYLGSVSDQKMIEYDEGYIDHLHDNMDVMGDKAYRYLTGFFQRLRRRIRCVPVKFMELLQHDLHLCISSD